MSDLILLLPELVLVGMALVLIVIARHVQRAQSVAICVVIAAAAAIYSGWAFSGGGPRTGFGGTISNDGYSQFFNVLFAATLALAALLSVKHVDAERVRPGEFYALLVLASTGMMLAASATDLLIVYLGLELMTMCSYIMVGITREKSISNEAAIKYFLLASFA